jgi:hypothetical protein
MGDVGSFMNVETREHSNQWMYTQSSNKQAKATNFVALVHERTIPTERPQLVGEVIANFCG